MTLKVSIKKRNWKYRNEKYIYLMLLMPIIGFLVFTLYPMLWAIRLSWFHYTGVPSETYFVGWRNFISVLSSDKFWGTYGTSLLFAVMKMPIELSTSLLLALFVSGSRKGAGFFRTMYFMPYIISVAIVGVVFSNMFGYFGIINGMLVRFGIIAEPINWFTSKMTAMWMIVITSIWQTFGLNVLYFVAALNSVPKELYESAKIDGAGSFQSFFHITIPCIMPVMRTILMLSLIGSIGTGDIILVTTGGAPAGKTFTTAAYMIYNYAPGFAGVGADIGHGSAMSLIVGLITMTITLSYMKVSDKASRIY